MAENSQGKKYGHEINFHGPYLDGQINLNFHIVSSSQDQITTIKEIADLIREEGTIPATGNYTYYEKQEESHEVEKKEVTEETKDEASGATPRPIMKIVDGIQVDGDGIKPIFAKEETSVEPKIMTMSLDSVSSTDDTIIYPTILSAEAPAVLADSSDDSKLITYGNLKAFAGLTDGRYVRLKSGDTAPGSYVTSTELSDLEDSVIKKGTPVLYGHNVVISNLPNTLQFYFYVVSGRSEEYTIDTLDQDFGNWSFGVSGHYNAEFVYQVSSTGTRYYCYYGNKSSTTMDPSILSIVDHVHILLTPAS